MTGLTWVRCDSCGQSFAAGSMAAVMMRLCPYCSKGVIAPEARDTRLRDYVFGLALAALVVSIWGAYRDWEWQRGMFTLSFAALIDHILRFWLPARRKRP